MAITVPLNYIVEQIQASVKADIEAAIERQLVEAVMPSIRETAAKVATEVVTAASVTLEKNFESGGFNCVVSFNGEAFKAKES